MLLAVVFGIAPLLLIQQYSPHLRTWVFLYPLYIAIAFSGLFLVAAPTRRNAFLLGIIAFALALVSIIPISLIKYLLDFLASDGDAAEVLTPHFRKLMHDIGVLGLVVALVGLFAYGVQRCIPPQYQRFTYYGTIAVAVMFWQGFNVISQQSVYHSNETATFRDSGSICEYIDANLRHEDTFVLHSIQASPIEYAFHRIKLPIDYLRFTKLELYPIFLAPRRVGEPLPERFHIITNENRGDVIDNILASLEAEPGVTLDGFGEPVLVEEFPESRIYRVTRVVDANDSATILTP